MSGFLGVSTSLSVSRKGECDYRGDLNFTIATHEIWVPNAIVDPLEDFFQNLLQSLKLVDLDPQKLKSNWTKKRTRKNLIAKRLYRFLVGGI